MAACKLFTPQVRMQIEVLINIMIKERLEREKNAF